MEHQSVDTIVKSLYLSYLQVSQNLQKRMLKRIIAGMRHGTILLMERWVIMKRQQREMLPKVRNQIIFQLLLTILLCSVLQFNLDLKLQ